MKLDELLAWQPYKVFEMDSWLMARQEDCGIGFDIEGAKVLVERIDREMTDIASEIEPQLPPRPLNKGELDKWRIPAKPWKKDGGLSSSMFKWTQRVELLVEGEVHVDGTDRTVSFEGSTYPIVGGQPTKTHGPMRLANEDDLKDFLLERGWEPTIWNLKRGKDKKPIRDENGRTIRTSPKFQENGRLCPNLEELDGELIRPVVRYLSLQHRRSMLSSRKNEEKGMLNSDRLAYDGRLSTGSSGITPTFRQKHVGVTNIPKAKAHVVLGVEMRALFRAQRPGYVLVGYDAKALENRVEASYCKIYEGGEKHAEIILNGDPHINNALAFFPEELAEIGFTAPSPEIEDHPVGSKYRGRSKNGRYCLGYGGSAEKLAATLGVSLERGRIAYDAFWEANPALSTLKSRLVEHWTKNGKKWIRGIDGRRISVRSKHSLVNFLFQSCGALVMDYSALYMHKWLGGLTERDESSTLHYSYEGHRVYRVGYFHDEFIWEVPEEIAEKIAEMGRQSIIKAGEFLKLRVPLDGTAKIGKNWAEIH